MSQDSIGAIGSLVISGASSYFTSKVLSVDLTRSIASVPKTPLDRTSGGPTFEPGRLTTWAMTGTLIFEPGDAVPLGTKGSVTLTYADATGTTMTWSTGFLSELSTPITHEEGIEATFTMTLSGDAA